MTFLKQAGELTLRALKYEINMWVSLYRWVFRRPVSREPGARAFGYARSVTPVLIVFIVVSAIEIPIVDLLLPWEGARVALLAAGFYGLLWMIGMLASLRVSPHVVAASGLRIRANGGLDITIPWDHIRSIQVSNRMMEKGRSLIYEGSVLHIAVGKQTNVDIAFRYPTVLELPRGDTPELSELRVAVDDPADLVAAAREFLPARPTAQAPSPARY